VEPVKQGDTSRRFVAATTDAADALPPPRPKLIRALSQGSSVVAKETVPAQPISRALNFVPTNFASLPLTVDILTFLKVLLKAN
jgi:hypothetical protein